MNNKHMGLKTEGARFAGPHKKRSLDFVPGHLTSAPQKKGFKQVVDIVRFILVIESG